MTKEKATAIAKLLRELGLAATVIYDHVYNDYGVKTYNFEKIAKLVTRWKDKADSVCWTEGELRFYRRKSGDSLVIF